MPAPIRATNALTLTGNALATETVTVASVAYTFTATPTLPNEVLIGATAAESLANLHAAINGLDGAGTLYGAGTVAHTLIRVTYRSPTAITVAAIIPGVVGNAYTATTTLTNGTWATPTFTGGVGGAGAITAWVDEILATSQVNADVYTDLKAIGTP